MRYEGLARYAFDNCQKYGDPWSYCAQDRYVNFVREPNLVGKRALPTILIKLILNNPDNEYTHRLKELEENVWEINSQKDVVTIVDECIAKFT